MKAIIEKKKHDNIVFLKEFKKEYDLKIEYEKKDALYKVIEAINDFEDFYNLNEWEIDNSGKKEIEKMKNLSVGSYSLDCGDYTYYIKIN